LVQDMELHDRLQSDETSLKEKLEALYHQLDKLSGGVLSIVADTIGRFTDARGSEAAAAMAYYTLFSLFPLLLALVAVGGYFLQQPKVFDEVVSLLSRAFPISHTLISDNLQQILQVRGAIGIVGIIGAVWSGTGVFSVLSNNINEAWKDAELRSFLQGRLVALGMAGVLAILLVLSVVGSTAVDVLSQIQVPLLQRLSVYSSPIWMAASTAIPWVLTFFLFLALYWWVPTAKVKFSAAFWAALVVTIAWEAASALFALYVSSGLARYKIVYGSLGSVAALMFWIYVSSWIIIFGAHLSAAIAQREQAGPGEVD
jgi:membrane protein